MTQELHSAQGYLQERAWRAAAGQVMREYDSDELTLGIVVNQSQKGRAGSKLFVKVPIAHHLVIRSNTDIVVRLNAATEDPITVEGGILLDLHWVEFTDLFISTVAASNPLKIIVA